MNSDSGFGDSNDALNPTFPMLGKATKHSQSPTQPIHRLMVSTPNSFSKLYAVLPRSNGHGWEARAVYQALHVEKKLSCLQSQPGFVFPFLSSSRTVLYMQPLAKWALIPFETSRCYCHTDKPWVGRSLPHFQPLDSGATPSARACFHTGRVRKRSLTAPEQQLWTFKSWLCEVSRRGCP